MSKKEGMCAPGGEANQEEGNVTILVDPFRIKLRARAGDLGEAPPQNWKEVANQVNRHLMRIAAGSTRLLSEVMEGATRIVRGISEVPTALARRIENSHVVADVAEEMKQEVSEEKRQFSSPEDASLRLNAILERYRAEGFVAGVNFDSNGRPIVVVVRPEHAAVVEEICRLTDGGLTDRKRLGPAQSSRSLSRRDKK